MRSVEQYHARRDRSFWLKLFALEDGAREAGLATRIEEHPQLGPRVHVDLDGGDHAVLDHRDDLKFLLADLARAAV